MLKLLVAFVCIGMGLQARAEMDKGDSEALQKTVELMNSPAARDEAIAKDPEAKKADQYAKQVGGAYSEEIYALSGKLFEKLVAKYGTDMTKINEVLQNALRDPAGFASTEFSADDIRALKALSEKLPQPNPSSH